MDDLDQKFIKAKYLNELRVLLDEVESYLVFPFEGTLLNSDGSSNDMQEKITSYNRAQFNKLKTRWLPEEIL